MPDLKKALGDLQQLFLDDVSDAASDPQPINGNSEFTVGEHVAVFWIEQNIYTWYLGCIDHVTDEGIFVSHFVPSRKGKREWTFPDEMDIQLVEVEQILQRSIPISYLQSARIRCCIE